MLIDTTRFGPIDVEEKSVVTFPEGIPAFEEYHRFVFVAHPGQDKSGPFKWMQSLDESALAFLTMEPRFAFAGYAPKLSTSDLEAIGLQETGLEPRLHILLTVPAGDPSGITANLLAPIIVNPVTRIARQAVAAGDQYGVRHPLLPQEARADHGAEEHEAALR